MLSYSAPRVTVFVFIQYLLDWIFINVWGPDSFKAMMSVISADHRAVDRLSVCRLHVPMLLVILAERPLYLVCGSGKREIV